MSETTELRELRIVGPRLALTDPSLDSEKFTWHADLSVAYLGTNRPKPEDAALVNYTQGLRVLLQAPESDAKPTPIKIDVEATLGDPTEPAIKETVQLRAPHLLIGNVHPRGSTLTFAERTDGYALRAAVPEADPEKGKTTRGFSSLVLTPFDPWPTPQTDRQIEVPRFAIGEQRLRVLISVTTMKPVGFLRLAKLSDTTAAAFVGTGSAADPAKLPRVELPLITIVGEKNGPFVAVDLTPDGIELRGTVVNPLNSFGDAAKDRVNVILRLVHKADPLSPDRAVWSLELVREEDKCASGKIGNRIWRTLEAVRTAFGPGRDQPLVLDIDTVADNPAVRWPLELESKSLRLPGSDSGDWHLWVDGEAVHARLSGSPVRDGELPTEVTFVPNLLALSRSGTKVELNLDADRREVGLRAKSPDDILGPRVTLTRTGKTSTQVSIDDAKADLAWFLDRNALARNLAGRYAKAGVHPAGAATTYAFIPLTDGWLQLPLGLDGSEDGAVDAIVATDSIGFDGSVTFVIDDPKQSERPRGRRLEIAAADHVHATAEFIKGAATTLLIELRGAAGTVDGVLWVASGSPSPENILPQFDGGPAALMGPALAFSRLATVPAHLMPLTSGKFAPGTTLKLTLPVTSTAPPLCYLWRGYADLPLVTAIGMTRTAESSGNPSSTRGLLCREFARTSYAITLVYTDDRGFASLTLTDQKKPVALDAVPLVGGDTGPFQQVPLVPVTLPGIELRSGQVPFKNLDTRLRFDLPVLDELFANTRLPEKAQVNTENAAPEPPPPDAPTSLDFDRLKTAWQKAVDRLDLSRVQEANAVDFGTQARTVKIANLFEGATWTTNFALATTVDIESTTYAFGTYDLGGEHFSARQALQGLTKAFDVKPDLVDAAKNSKNPLRVIGFAAALWEETRDGLTGWRDTRAALTARLPAAEPFGDKKNGDPDGLLLRDIGVIDLDDKTTARFSRATVAKPIPVALPIAADRKLGLWFRDLPLESKKANALSLVQNADGPELTIGPRQSAFDRALLPRSIYEWRLCNDAVAAAAWPPSAYEIPLGPFRFRPLRLLDVALAKGEGWSASSAKVCGMISLTKAGASTLDKGPFEPELAYANGNLVAISLAKSGDGLTFAGAGWEGVEVDIDRESKKKPAVASGGAAQLSFRIADVPVLFGSGGRESGRTTLQLGLTASDTAATSSLPQFSAATLTAVLFGRLSVFEKGKVTIEAGGITATFTAPSGASDLKDASGVQLTSVKLSILAGGETKLFLEARLKVAAADPAAEDDEALDVIQHTLGEPLFWLNHQIKEPSVSITVDHRRGVIKIAGTLDETSIQPIVGLTAAEAKVRVGLTVAVLSDKKEKAPNPAYIYTSVSGFGEYSLSSEKGPVKRFGHVVAGKDKTPGAVWTSRITVDLSLQSRESRIHWPIGSLPKTLKTLDTKQDIELAKLAALVSARALRGALGPFDAKTALKHVVTMSVTGQAIAMSALHVVVNDNKPRVAFATPWTFHALAEHRIIDPQEKGRNLAWTTLDHVNAIDAHILIDAAKTAVKLPQPFKDGIFAFAARYRKILPSEGSKSPVIKGGIVLRAFAQAGFPVEALAIELAKLPDPPEDGIIISAAGPTTVETKPALEGPFWPDMPPDTAFISEDRHGVVLALPWLTALDENYQLGSVLIAFDQAPATESAAWDAPDVDWAAGSPAPLARKPAVVQPIGAGSAVEIAALLASALQRVRDAAPVRALSAVEQLFLRPEKAGAKLKERPIWLRSLLALQTVWLATEDAKRAADGVATIDDRVIMVVPSSEADGSVARFKLGPRRRPDETEEKALAIGASGQLIAIDRERTAFEPMSATEIIGTPSGGGGGADATRRARLASRADQLVKEPAAVIAVAAQSTVDDTDATIWIRVGIPPDFDDGALDIPVEIDAKVRLYASPALGWPTARGTAQAATGAIGMGADRAFQDAGPEDDPPKPKEGTPDDVKRYGSGLSGRAASLSLPARADTGERPDDLTSADRFIDTRSPVFIALGRKMIFYRPKPADLPVVSPPARHLSPTEARAVVPVSQDLQGVLSRVVKGQAAPIVPPHLERTTFGLRPGAMQAEFDTLLFTDGLASSEIAANKQEDMSPGIRRFGRPGHAGPRLVRQLRPPRGPALPRVPLSPQDFVTSHGRRTFVELDDHATELKPDGTGEVKEQDARFPTPFRLFEGVATVLRRHYKKKSRKVVDESYRIRLLDMPLPSEWDGRTLRLHVTSPSYQLEDVDGLADALAKLGLLREPVKEVGPPPKEDAGLGTALSIDRFIVRFSEANWSRVDDAIILTLQAETVDRVDLRARLDAVDGDTQVILQLRCAQENDNAVVPPAKFALATNPDQAKQKLEPESRRQFALRVPVRPTAQPSLNVSISTLVFADPSYDRELSGPGPSDSQRDKDGRLWKVALDRFEYGTDTAVYFGFGPIDAKTGLFGDAAPTKVRLTLQRQPAKNDDKDPLPPENLLIANVTDVAGQYEIEAAKAYGITFDQLLDENQHPVKFLDGDQIVVSIGFKDAGGVARNLSVRAMVVPRPIIAPPPAVYALVAPFDDTADATKKTARVTLHATAPPPQRIEFPSLLDDLAIGHIRRRALFIWRASDVPDASPKRATLVKIDRAGGGQVPEGASDLFSRLPRRTHMAVNIVHNVAPIAQTKTMSCWAAAAAMLLTWKNGIPYTEFSAAQAAGNNFVISFQSNTGLAGTEVAELANALHLKAEPPQNWTVAGYANLLTARGPLWVGTAIFSATLIYRHVRILRGLTGDGTFSGTTARIVDPDGGNDYQKSVADFAIELEEIAKQDLGAGEELKPQVIRFP